MLRIVRTEALAGESVVAFLQQKGFPEVALHLVTDESLRLQLAIECGNLDVALEAAKALDTPEGWTKLGDAALAQGNVSVRACACACVDARRCDADSAAQVMEMTLQRSKAFERLGFLYAITGNTDKSRKMLTVAQKRQDPSARFHNALLVGDARERVNVLLEAGMLPLAYACAAKHGMHEKAAEIAEMLGGQVPELPKGDGELLLPPTPVLREGNWPLLSVQRTLMSNALKKGGTAFDADAGAAAADAVGGWGADDDDGAAGAGGDGGDGAAWGEVGACVRAFAFAFAFARVYGRAHTRVRARQTMALRALGLPTARTRVRAAGTWTTSTARRPAWARRRRACCSTRRRRKASRSRASGSRRARWRTPWRRATLRRPRACCTRWRASSTSRRCAWHSLRTPWRCVRARACRVFADASATPQARASMPLLPGTPQVVSYLGGVTPPATVSLEALIERVRRVRARARALLADMVRVAMFSSRRRRTRR